MITNSFMTKLMTDNRQKTDGHQIMDTTHLWLDELKT